MSIVPSSGQPPAKAEGAYWAVAELAAHIGKTPRWVADRCMPSHPNRLPHRKVGRTNMFSAVDVVAIDRLFAVDQTVEPAVRTVDPELLGKGLRILARSRATRSGAGKER